MVSRTSLTEGAEGRTAIDLLRRKRDPAYRAIAESFAQASAS